MPDATATQDAGIAAAGAPPPQEEPQAPNLPMLGYEFAKACQWFELSLMRGDRQDQAIRHCMATLQSLDQRLAVVEAALSATTQEPANEPRLFDPKTPQ